jgi:proteasome lid subunit RPN8/RPN11
MSLRMSEAVVEKIIAHARKDVPIEACGYLTGDGEVVTGWVPLTNVDASPEHYSLDPGEQFITVRSLREQGLQVMAVYHSHPCSPARMSQEDIRLAYDPNISYVIVSLLDPAAVKSFRCTGGVVHDELLEIVNTGGMQ